MIMLRLRQMQNQQIIADDFARGKDRIEISLMTNPPAATEAFVGTIIMSTGRFRAGRAAALLGDHRTPLR